MKKSQVTRKNAGPRTMHVRFSDPTVLKLVRAFACKEGITLSQLITNAIERRPLGEAPPDSPARTTVLMHVRLPNVAVFNRASQLAHERGMSLSKFVELSLREAIDKEWAKSMVHGYEAPI